MPDQFSIASNFTQSIIDPADGLNEAELLLTPADGSPRNVHSGRGLRRPGRAEPGQRGAGGGDRTPALRSVRAEPPPERVHAARRGDPGDDPRQRRRRRHRRAPAERSGDARGQHRHRRPARSPSCPSSRIPRSTRSTAASRRSSAASAFPNAGILDSVLDWFADIVTNGTPGTFSFDGTPYFNPIQNADVPAGASTNAFFARTVNAGGAAPFTEPTPDVTVSFVSNVVASRVTAGRSILGATAQATDSDVPPGTLSTVGTPGFLPFFVTLQRGDSRALQRRPDASPTRRPISRSRASRPARRRRRRSSSRTSTPARARSAAPSAPTTAGCGANGPCVGAGYTPLPVEREHGAAHRQHERRDQLLHLRGGASRRARGRLPPAARSRRRQGRDRLPRRVAGRRTRPTRPSSTSTGFPSRIQACTDGDPACDADRTADGTCTFRVGVCLDQADPNLLGLHRERLDRLPGAEAGAHVEGSDRQGERRRRW